MCNTLSTQRQIVAERLATQYANDVHADVRVFLAEAFDAGVMEAEREEAPPIDDGELDEAMREIEAERDAQASGSVEPPKGDWLNMIGVKR